MKAWHFFCHYNTKKLICSYPSTHTVLNKESLKGAIKVKNIFLLKNFVFLVFLTLYVLDTHWRKACQRKGEMLVKQTNIHFNLNESSQT